MKSFVFLMLTATATTAETLLTPEMFEQMTEGRTFYYGQNSEPYGAEEYLPNRRVRWTFLDGQCEEGEWYVELDLICFVYDANPVPQCWSFYQEDGGGLIARFENDPNATTLYEMSQSDDPLRCLGPDVGV